MYLPYSKIEVRSLRRNSTGLYCRPVYISYVRFLCGNSAGNLVAARQLLASRKIFNCEWIRSNIHFLLNHERMYLFCIPVEGITSTTTTSAKPQEY
jgi:hypothetical protein